MCALLQTTEVVQGSTTFLGFGINLQGEPNITSALNPIFDPAKADLIEYEFPRQAPDISTTFLIPSYASPGPCAEDQSSYTNLAEATTRTETQMKFATRAGISIPIIPAFPLFFDTSYEETHQMTQEYFYCFYLSNTVTGTICVSTSNTSDPFLSDAFKSDVENLPATFDKTNPSNVSAWFTFFQTYGGYFVSDLIYGGSINYFNAVSTVTTLDRTKIKISFGINVLGFKIGSQTSITDDYTTYKQNSVYQFSTIGGNKPLNFDPRLGSDELAKEAFDSIAAWQETVPMSPNENTDIRLKAIADLSFVITRGKNGAMNSAFEHYLNVLSPTIQVNLQRSDTQETSINPPRPLPSINKPSITLAGQDVNDLRKPVTQILPEQCLPSKDMINMGFQVVILDPTKIPAKESVLWNKYYPVNFASSFPFCTTIGTFDPLFKTIEIDNLNIYSNFVNDYRNSANKINTPNSIFIFSTYNIPSSFSPDFNMSSILLSNGASTLGPTYEQGTVGTFQNWVTSVRQEGKRDGSKLTLNTNFPSTYTLIGRISADNTGVEVFGYINPPSGDESIKSISSILEAAIYKKNLDDTRPAIALNQATVIPGPA
ncbi:MAC/Perforin domain-containing protein [Marininema mesophilum]|uniref:MAC/Perforin domain-containing protein n=1 Tax=Marininema mesophilum TaxID=1048340 RepID=A0A1H3D248_9BACL|nr:MAC/perforin domain-containing protein [Marininema mesophilum]SDX60471.1 MAC/Perforin domain-containing protein [Marininema mesophilum]